MLHDLVMINTNTKRSDSLSVGLLYVRKVRDLLLLVHDLRRTILVAAELEDYLFELPLHLFESLSEAVGFS